MGAIVRNVLLACLISTFAFFGALGDGATHHKADRKLTPQQIAIKDAERSKESLTCLGVAGLAWVLCFWRCGVINRRINTERIYQQRFNEYMRNSAFTRHY
ncbi:hypothetical protein [Mucilaginibacter sp. SG564]|uniref:hypothetical protein n=1 Tax=Mucilaginibacter sp. SG564 TaxID=2587022 RepID=UPI001553ECB4|nr:hypothetical protein [Mucilaginibacter sp. SG564]NOW95951.1 hypothetical protein [Mucilaginibacter sp. SG564]